MLSFKYRFNSSQQPCVDIYNVVAVGMERSTEVPTSVINSYRGDGYSPSISAYREMQSSSSMDAAISGVDYACNTMKAMSAGHNYNIIILIARSSDNQTPIHVRRSCARQLTRFCRI